MTRPLKPHDRYDYVPIHKRPDYSFPNGRRLAVYLGFNLEHFDFGAGLGARIGPESPQPDVSNYAWRDYGNRVGVWNLLELMDEYAIPGTVLLNTAIYEECPQVAAGFRQRGFEFVGHGRTNAERQAEFDPEAERRLLEECRSTIARHEGRPPEGWMGPWISETFLTPDLVAEAGYGYLLDWAPDDQPLWFATRSSQKLLSIPYARPTNDLPQLHGGKVTPAAYAEILIDQIEEMLLQSRKRPLVFNLSLHPFLIGHAFRLRHLRRVFERFARHRDQIWLTTSGAIAEHIRALPAGIVP